MIVTGGAGFVGQELVRELLARGKDVHIIDNFFLRKPHPVPEGAVLHQVDIRDRERVRDTFAEVRPDTVFHLAAQTSVTYSMRHPMEDLEINVMGAMNVLEGAREASGPERGRVERPRGSLERGAPQRAPSRQGDRRTGHVQLEDFRG